MNQEVEIEFKNLVTKQEFDKALQFFHIPRNSFREQDNHYFDTPNFDLKEKGCALRIRRKNGVFTLTLKQPLQTGLLETHDILTEEEANNFINAGTFPHLTIYPIIQTMNINPGTLEHFGSLKTNRSEIPYKNGILVLDHSTYLNKEDYELEYEVMEIIEGRTNFFQLLKTLNIPIRTAENKVKRFYKAKFQL